MSFIKLNDFDLLEEIICEHSNTNIILLFEYQFEGNQGVNFTIYRNLQAIAWGPMVLVGRDFPPNTFESTEGFLNYLKSSSNLITYGISCILIQSLENTQKDRQDGILKLKEEKYQKEQKSKYGRYGTLDNIRNYEILESDESD